MHRIRIAALLLLASLLAGCGNDDGRLETHPVTGQVFIDGEPVSGCTVAFVPLDAERKGTILPGGKTDEAGEFRLTTYETGDGAPAGEYGVTLRWEATKWSGMQKELEIDPVAPIGPDRLMGKFSSPEKSQLTATVSNGENVLEPFLLFDVPLLAGSE